MSPEMKVLTASFLSPIYASSALKSGLSEFFDAFCTHVYDGIEGYDKKIAAYRRMVGKNRTYRRWVKAFPHLQKERHHRRLEELRAYIARRNAEQDEREETK